MSGLVVVEGAELTCTAGAATTALVVTSQVIESIDGLAVATISDSVGLINVPTFGTCSLLTAEADGVSCPCAPVTTGTWTSGASSRTITELPVLTETDVLTCGVGGTITVSDPGQSILTAD